MNTINTNTIAVNLVSGHVYVDSLNSNGLNCIDVPEED